MRVVKYHGDIKQLMDESEKEYYKSCIRIEVRFALEECNLMKEYFPDCPIEKLRGLEYRMFIDVPANERLWKALLLSFGNKIRVIAPNS
ncbi:MAG: WYL domain-containing protein [Velocimicrobium sp.]